MPTYQCEVVEEVTVRIEYEIEADTPEEAAQIAHDKWVNAGEGDPQESVDERWVEVDGETVDHEADEEEDV